MPLVKRFGVDWNAVRAEYVSGTISLRRLAEKHDIPFPTVRDRAKREEWQRKKDEIRDKSETVTLQKAVETSSDNAAIAARIKKKLLLRLEHEIDSLPDKIGSEAAVNIVTWGKNEKGNKQRTDKTMVNKLKDLTGAYKDLTDDMPKEQNNSALDKLDAMLAEVKKVAAHS